VLDGTPRPDHGAGWWERVCSRCSASWVGHETDGDEWCPWCERYEELADEMARRELLDPPALRTDSGTRRYDALTELEQAVWRRTRGQLEPADGLIAWIVRLRRAVDHGLITRAEAEAAIRRVTR